MSKVKDLKVDTLTVLNSLELPYYPTQLPLSAEKGMLAYLASQNVVAYWTGTQWVELLTSGSGDSSWRYVADGALNTLCPNPLLPGATSPSNFVAPLPASSTEGPGTRIMLDYTKAAFRAGSITGTQWDDAFRGPFSVAFGLNNTASAQSTFVAGQDNIVSALGGTASGSTHNVSGIFGTAFGRQHVISGNYSTAVGFVNTIAGDFSFAAGRQNNISVAATYSAAIGQANALTGDHSFVCGSNNTVSNVYSAAMGQINNVSGGYSLTSGQSNVVAGDVSGAIGYTLSVPSRASFACGSNNTAGGDFSFVAGQSNTINVGATNSLAAGLNNTVSALCGIAVGQDHDVSGIFGTAFGRHNIVSGNYSTAVGSDNNVSGQYSAAIGRNHTVSGQSSAAIGQHNTVSALCGTAAGQDNDVSGIFGTAFGRQNIISGNYSTAVGFVNTLAGDFSFAAGQSNTINVGADHSIVLGQSATINHNNVFMFSDGNALASAAAGEFVVGASGGTRIYTNAARTTGMFLGAGLSAWAAVSDINSKENLVQLDSQEILVKVEQLPIYEYNYKGTPADIKYRGPVAQDWHRLFPSGKPDLVIDTVDLDGITLAALKGLAAKVRAQSQYIKTMEKDFEARIKALEAKLTQ